MQIISCRLYPDALFIFHFLHVVIIQAIKIQRSYRNFQEFHYVNLKGEGKIHLGDNLTILFNCVTDV